MDRMVQPPLYQQSQIANPPTSALGPGAGTSSGLPPTTAIADSKETKPSGWSLANPTRKRHFGLIANSRSLAKQKGKVANDLFAAKDPMVTISIILYFVFGL
ncbi:hypothetical protein J1N35_037370 [Gossypium stocksii]|uniref:Uncharacterized protein n=1 Tax=Gossypium stocksii TaxID=47602 RepID=A0A9D3UK20_9ROSI|nr:hypothetical protein J1N35_037370 [Gossypium stocksii]